MNDHNPATTKPSLTCNYMWTTTDGMSYHMCPQPPNHDGPHTCDIEGCEETYDV